MFISSWQGKLRLARDAAENGLVNSVSELNKPANRMLVGSVPLNKWTTDDTDILTDGNYIRVKKDSTIYPKPCMYLVFNNPQNPDERSKPWNEYVYKITEQALFMAAASVDTTKRLIQDSENGQFYRVLGIKLTDMDRLPISRANGKAADNAVSYLTITVEGIYSLGTAPTTANPYPPNSVHYTVQQEYQLVPRCCRQIAYPVDTGSTSNACAAVNPIGAYKPEWIARSTSQAGLFKTNQ